MISSELACTLEVDIEYDSTPPKVLQLLNHLAGLVDKFRADEPNDYLQVGPTITWSTAEHRSRWKATTSLYRQPTPTMTTTLPEIEHASPQAEVAPTPAAETKVVVEQTLPASTDAEVVAEVPSDGIQARAGGRGARSRHVPETATADQADRSTPVATAEHSHVQVPVTTTEHHSV